MPGISSVSPAGRAAVLTPLGLALAVLLAVSGVPGAAVVDWRQHRGAGTVLSHAAVALVAAGLAPLAWRALLARADRPRVLARALWLAIAVAAVALATLAVAAPRHAVELVAREWGLVEPAQVALYVVAAGLAFRHARLLAADGPRRAAYRLAGAALLVFAAEEVDYLGLPALVVRLAGGSPEGRIGRHHVAGLHDLLNIGSTSGAAWLVTRLAALAIAAGLLVALRRVLPALLRELRAPEARPALLGAVLLAVAELQDIDDGLLRAVGLPAGKVVEEGGEALAAMALVAWLARAVARTVAAGVTPAPRRPTA